MGPGCGVVPGTDGARIGDEGAWFDVFSVAESKEEVFCVVKADGVFGLQCCCWGAVRERSGGAVQWFWGRTFAAVCGCVSLVVCGSDGRSVLLLWLSRDSWAMISARWCPSWGWGAS